MIIHKYDVFYLRNFTYSVPNSLFANFEIRSEETEEIGTKFMTIHIPSCTIFYRKFHVETLLNFFNMPSIKVNFILIQFL
jgi:hypothetical protein